MKEQILKLREEGKTYNQIRGELRCSKSIISYYCGEGQKEKAKKRSDSRRFTVKGNIERRIDGYIRRMSRDFRNSTKLNKRKITTSHFKVEDVLNKLGNIPKCYLTGDNIDLLDYKSYQFDHIIPVDKDGDNSLENLGIATRNANMSKSDMELGEYLLLCERVLRNHKPELFN